MVFRIRDVLESQFDMFLVKINRQVLIFVPRPVVIYRDGHRGNASRWTFCKRAITMREMTEHTLQSAQECGKSAM
jgi:hypothetical protein